jgi:hypothetical protein
VGGQETTPATCQDFNTHHPPHHPSRVSQSPRPATHTGNGYPSGDPHPLDCHLAPHRHLASAATSNSHSPAASQSRGCSPIPPPRLFPNPAAASNSSSSLSLPNTATAPVLPSRLFPNAVAARKSRRRYSQIPESPARTSRCPRSCSWSTVCRAPSSLAVLLDGVQDDRKGGALVLG